MSQYIQYVIQPKPKQIRLGGNLLYVAYFLEMGCRWLQGVDIAAFLFALFLIGYFVFKVNEGKNWARNLILIIAILNTILLPFALWQLHSLPIQNKDEFMIVTMGGLDYVIEIAALVLLFTKPANAWFNRNRAL